MPMQFRNIILFNVYILPRRRVEYQLVWNLRASHFDTISASKMRLVFRATGTVPGDKRQLSDDEETCPWPPNLLKEARAAKSASAHDRSADQENIDPAPLYRKIDRLEGKVAFAKSQLQEEKTKTVEARVQQQNTRRPAERTKATNVMLRDRLKSTEAFKDDMLVE
ncbi:hypothetical protein B0H14DRAFT_3154277 [Mycena olivaceomarginata]|nr:hypothetical protein B0H14DRAFT_3154277 [Mycena olivaceomarginata]